MRFILDALDVNMALHLGIWIFYPHIIILHLFSNTIPHCANKHKKLNPAMVCMPFFNLEFLQESLVPSVSSVQTVEMQGNQIKQGKNVKKSTTVLQYMDYWHILKPAGRDITLVSLLNWMRVSRTGASRVKVIGLTSEYHVCNPLVQYLCSLLVLDQQGW